MIRYRENFIAGWKYRCSMLTLDELKLLKNIVEIDIKERAE
jgi:hypothetical protein